MLMRLARTAVLPACARPKENGVQSGTGGAGGRCGSVRTVVKRKVMLACPFGCDQQCVGLHEVRGQQGRGLALKLCAAPETH
jgi:hypothetical protein